MNNKRPQKTPFLFYYHFTSQKYFRKKSQNFYKNKFENFFLILDIFYVQFLILKTFYRIPILKNPIFHFLLDDPAKNLKNIVKIL
tara:strand:- start:1560 stop:1814 length:255 start_codon:yes stop_codon:yes gene_type:complete